MSHPIDVFIGLVTHPRTRFTESSGPRGLMAQLKQAGEALGLVVTTMTLDRDLIDDEGIATDRAAIASAIDAEADVMRRWDVHIDRPHSIGMRIRRNGWRAWRSLRLSALDRSQGAQVLRRLANIELAHLSLLQTGQSTGARWVLILEDDARCDEPEPFMRSLQALATDPVRFINVSASFSPTELGIASLLTDVGPWPDGTTQRRILSADRPITNTVCAIVYAGAFLPELLEVLIDIPLEPIVPIDWKLNEALMRLSASGVLGPGDCWLVDPAPITQGSMHEVTAD